MGPSLYMFKGAVYDRVADADVRVKSDVQITSMMARKQSYYSERTVYPWVTEGDLEMGLLDAVRDALRANDADHPWLSLSDGELLRAARLYGRDQLTGERGFNLAAVALLGKEDAILDVMPLYRTDAVLRRVEADRYDDRLVCRSNLVRAYDELVGFCEKWLPDSFVLDGGAAQERPRRHRPRACVQLPHPPGVRQPAHRPHRYRWGGHPHEKCEPRALRRSRDARESRPYSQEPYHRKLLHADGPFRGAGERDEEPLQVLAALHGEGPRS